VTGATGGVGERGSAWRVLRHRDYRLLWSGQLVSLAGTQVQTVAVAWQVYALTNSPVQLGLLGLLRAGPMIVLSLVGGVFADAVDRRRLLIVTQAALLALSAALAAATAAGAATIWLIYAVTLLAGAASAFDGPARQALIPGLVPREELAAALTLNITARQLATILGPSVGGLIVAGAGVASAYTVDAASFGAVIAVLVLMRADIRGPLVARRGGLGALLEGLGFVRGNHLVFSMMGLDFLATFFGSVQALLPIYARDILRVGPEGLGLLYTATSVGAMLGAIALSGRGRIRAQGPILLLSIAVYGLCVAGFGLSHTFWLSAALLGGSGAADTVSTVLRGSILQLATPDELRGRVTAVHMAFAMGGPQLGQVRAGVVADRFTPAGAAVSGGLVCVAAVLAVAALVPKVRQYRV
jgi:MFS family permease